MNIYLRCCKCLTAGALALALTPPLQAAGQVRDVRFAQGSNSAVLKGTVRGDAYVDHTLRAGAGQTMTVKLDSAMAYFNVLPPGSVDVAIYNSSVNGNQWVGSLGHTGLYTIRVYLMRNEARRGKIAPFTLEVSVTGDVQVGDAKVKGTPFHATGNLPCSIGTAEPTVCPFGVIRSGAGQAEVRITPPGGLERVLKFGSQQVSAPGSLTIKSVRQGDEWMIEVNDVERYRVPDAVVNGG